MITIQNISGPQTTALGTRVYEVRINGEHIVTFTHKREDGLGLCLLEASKAVQKQWFKEAAELVEQGKA